MSDNALREKCKITRLMTHSKRESLKDEVFRALELRDSALPTRALKFSKDGYASLDIVIDQGVLSTSFGTKDFEPALAETLKSKAWVRNGNVSSFEFKGHQVNFIQVPYGTVALNATLLGYDGAGGLIQYLAQPYNLKLTQSGLFYVLKNGDENIGYVFYSNRFGAIMPFLKLDYYYSAGGSFHYGFEQREDVYASILRNDLFTLSAYDINENFEYVGDASRLNDPSFAGFVKYVAEEGLRRRAQGTPQPWPVAPEPHQLRHVKTFIETSSLIDSCKAVAEAYYSNKLVRSKFNSETVMVATGIESGEDLDLFTEAYKATFPSLGEFEFFVKSSTPDTIRDSIQRFHANYKKPEIKQSPETSEVPKIPELVVTRRRTRKIVKLEPPADAVTFG